MNLCACDSEERERGKLGSFYLFIFSLGLGPHKNDSRMDSCISGADDGECFMHPALI